MERSGHDSVALFIGTELENSIMKGESTLFVVDDVDYKDIDRALFDQQITHLYLAANKSYSRDLMPYYKDIIGKLTKRTINVTLDFPASDYEFIQSELSEFIGNEYFIPMMNVEVPKFHTMKNIAVRFDDVDFGKTNPGVWVVNEAVLNTDECYTPWEKYSGDIVIKRKGSKLYDKS